MDTLKVCISLIISCLLEKTEFQDVLKVIRLAENVGLGAALSKGLPECTCEWVARMDSDDIAASDRCEKQMAYLQAHPEVDVLSGTIEEFQGNVGTEREARDFVLSTKTVPRTQEEVSSYIKMRNPVNHPCVMFRKSKVLAAGGYQPCPLFEDYDLWVRMYQNGCRFANLPDTLLSYACKRYAPAARGHFLSKTDFSFLDRHVPQANAQFSAVYICTAIQSVSQPVAKWHAENDLRQEIKESQLQ